MLKSQHISSRNGANPIAGASDGPMLTNINSLIPFSGRTSENGGGDHP
jgi:hypothetical protein